MKKVKLDASQELPGFRYGDSVGPIVGTFNQVRDHANRTSIRSAHLSASKFITFVNML